MLDKNDKDWIKKTITDAFSEFYESIFAPYADRHERLQKDTRKSIEEIRKENDDDHEQIFRKLKHNQDEHDRMFVQLDSIEEQVKGHEKRIKRIEKVITAS